VTYIIKKFITLAQDMDKTVCETKAYSTESHVLGKKKELVYLFVLDTKFMNKSETDLCE